MAMTCAPRARDLLDVRDDLPGRGCSSPRRRPASALVEERDRAVLHLGLAEYASVGMYEISELERALERHGQPDVTPQVEEEARVVVALRDLLDRMIAVEEGLDLARQLVDVVEDELLDLAGGVALHLRQLHGDEVEQRHLRRERLDAATPISMPYSRTGSSRPRA